MTCKHRWEPSNFGFKYIPPDIYLYRCTRCGNIISAILKEKQA
jgi:hypothetical protein